MGSIVDLVRVFLGHSEEGLEHRFLGRLGQFIDICRCQIRRGNWGEHYICVSISYSRDKSMDEENTFDLNRTSIKPHIPRGQDMRVVLCDNRHDRNTSLDSQMESTLLKRQQLWIIRVTSRSLGENEDTLSMSAHFLRRTVKRLNSRLTISPVNEHRPGQRHEPSQKRHTRKRLLSRDTAVWRENGTQHEHVQLRLMVPNKHRRSSGEMFDTFDNVESYTRRIPHNPFEAACCSPLRNAAVSHQPQDDRGDYPVESTQQERTVGCQAPGNECCPGNFLAQGEERRRHDDERTNARGNVGEDGHGPGVDQ